MFLLVSGRHVGAHPDGLQHGVSIQISLNLGEKFPHILLKKDCCDPNLGESLCIFTFFLFPESILNGETLKTSNRQTDCLHKLNREKREITLLSLVRVLKIRHSD